MENIVGIQELIYDESGNTAENDEGGVLRRVLLENGKDDIVAVPKEFLPSFGVTVFSGDNNLETPEDSIAENSDAASSNGWSDESTRLLLDKYEQFSPQVGPMKKFKHKKAMWELISLDMKSLNSNKSAVQCENRYKTIMKRKRQATTNNNTSGSKRAKVEFEDEIRKIAAIDDSIEPEVMQSAEQCIIKPKDKIEKIRKVTKAKETVQELALRMHTEKEENKRKRHEEKMAFLQNFAAIIAKNTNTLT